MDMRFQEPAVLDGFDLWRAGEDFAQAGRWKGAPANLSKWWRREVLDIFDIKLSICNLSVEFL